MPKYRFITVIHNLEYSEPEEIKLNSVGTISNNMNILIDTFNNHLTAGTIGVHSTDEFTKQTFFYLDGTFGYKTETEINQIGVQFTFALLRIIQNFAFELWKLKDNNLYVRDGFLYVYDKVISDGCTYKASVSAIPTLSDLTIKKSVLKSTEIKQVIENFEIKKVEDFYSEKESFKEPTNFHFFKKHKLSRIERSSYFIQTARNNGTFPMKILSYCTALECLFTSSRTELVHKIAERVAILLESESKDKLEVYNLIKRAYDIRSTIVHGSTLKGNNEDLTDVSVKIDEVVRKLINGNFEVFSKNDNEINQFFIENLLN